MMRGVLTSHKSLFLCTIVFLLWHVADVATGQISGVRRVRLQKLDAMLLNIAEVKVIDLTGANVALGKTASQSSTHLEYDASFAVNGQRMDFSHTEWDNKTQGVSVDGVGGET